MSEQPWFVVSGDVAGIRRKEQMIDCVYLALGIVAIAVAVFFHRQAAKEELPDFVWPSSPRAARTDGSSGRAKKHR
jgi:hypothetical protein